MIARHPTIRRIRRVAGEAGHVNYYVDVHTGNGARHFAFAGNIFVGPVLMTSRDDEGRWDHEVIDDPRRFGEFVSSEWIDRFLAARDEAPTEHYHVHRRFA